MPVRPVPVPGPGTPSRTQQPSLESLLLPPPASSLRPPHRITLHHLASIRYPTYRLHDLHNTLHSSSLVTSSHTIDTLVSRPSGDSRSTISALPLQNIFSREGDYGPAVSPQRTCSYWGWSEQSKSTAPTTGNPRRHLHCAALHPPDLNAHSRSLRRCGCGTDYLLNVQERAPARCPNRGVFYHSRTVTSRSQPCSCQRVRATSREPLSIGYVRENANKGCSIVDVTLHHWTNKATKPSRA